jgi:hypothetical protein
MFKKIIVMTFFITANYLAANDDQPNEKFVSRDRYQMQIVTTKDGYCPDIYLLDKEKEIIWFKSYSGYKWTRLISLPKDE